MEVEKDLPIEEKARCEELATVKQLETLILNGGENMIIHYGGCKTIREGSRGCDK